jgi:predicted metalloendopeptidase
MSIVTEPVDKNELKPFRDLKLFHLACMTAHSQNGSHFNPKRPVEWHEKRCLDHARTLFDHTLGLLYVRRHFSSEMRENVMKIVRDVKTAFIEMLEKVDWMDDETKIVAQEKAEKIDFQVGYADEQLDDKKLAEFYDKFDDKIDSENFDETLEKLKASREKHSDENVWSQLVKPANFTLENLLSRNAVHMSAGALHGVYFEDDRPSFMNYATVGFIVGHEVRFW